MNKKALRHKLDRLPRESPQEFSGINVDNIELYLDLTDPFPIINILKENKSKFKLIVREILLGRYNDSLYKKEDENVTAMKFTGTPNSRIYCLEVPGKKEAKKKIIMSKACLHKNVQKNDKRICELIESVKKSNYTYYENPEDINEHN